MTERGRRDGYALLLAILAVVVAGALIVATHAAVHLDLGVSASTVLRQRAFAASEYALWQAVAGWSEANLALPVGGSATVVVPAGRDTAAVTTVRLNEDMYWVVAESEAREGGRRARRRTAVNVRATFDSTGARASPVLRAWVELQ